MKQIIFEDKANQCEKINVFLKLKKKTLQSPPKKFVDVIKIYGRRRQYLLSPDNVFPFTGKKSYSSVEENTKKRTALIKIMYKAI